MHTFMQGADIWAVDAAELSRYNASLVDSLVAHRERS